jgi:hypothetical protein
MHEQYSIDTAGRGVRNDKTRVGKLEEEVLRVLPADAHRK